MKKQDQDLEVIMKKKDQKLAILTKVVNWIIRSIIRSLIIHFILDFGLEYVFSSLDQLGFRFPFSHYFIIKPLLEYISFSIDDVFNKINNLI